MATKYRKSVAGGRVNDQGYRTLYRDAAMQTARLEDELRDVTREKGEAEDDARYQRRCVAEVAQMLANALEDMARIEAERDEAREAVLAAHEDADAAREELASAHRREVVLRQELGAVRLDRDRVRGQRDTAEGEVRRLSQANEKIRQWHGEARREAARARDSEEALAVRNGVLCGELGVLRLKVNQLEERA